LVKRNCHFGFRSIEILQTFDDMFNTNDKILPSDHIDFGQLALHMDTVQSIINAGRISDTHDRDAIINEHVWLGPILSRSIRITPGRFSLLQANSQDFILQRPTIETILSHEWFFRNPAHAELFVVVKWVDLAIARPETLSDTVIQSVAFGVYRIKHLALDRYVRARFRHVVEDPR